MNAFDKIIGYASIKKELWQISDMLKNAEPYRKLGVSAPRGLLLYGEPGVGKSLMANAVIEASGRKCFTCRKDSPGGDFTKKIKSTFEQAAQHAPAIVCLDDMDKFSNLDEDHPDAEEYVTVQACIDDVRDKPVFVLATANKLCCFPNSLLRPGRFDRMIHVAVPCNQDAVEIITHYLKSKSFMDDVDPLAVSRMMHGRSCAELETVINEAGLYAGYERVNRITMEHFMKACLRTVFDMSSAFALEDGQNDCNSGFPLSTQPFAQNIYHEAGHAVVAEVLYPGSVSMIYANSTEQKSEGVTSYYNDNSRTPLYWKISKIIVSLGGKAAVEHKFGGTDLGCRVDLAYAYSDTRELIEDHCINGFQLYAKEHGDSQLRSAEQEKAILLEIEKYYHKAREIILLNYDFFQKLAAALAQKKLLSAADVQKIKSECKIVPVTLEGIPV